VLKLQQLTLDGIGRFVNTQEIDFTSLGNLVQVDGKNNNTGGSSGAGKSTVFNALDYLFGLNDIPNSSLQSRLTKETMNVSAVFDWDGKAVKIQRGKKLYVEIDGQVVTGSNKLAEEAIDKVIGMPRDLFRKLLHKRQKEGGFFLQLTPKETHSFLSDVLGLGDLAKKTETLDKKIKELTEASQKAKTAHYGTQQALQSNQNALDAIGAAPAPEVDQATVLDLKAKLDAALALLEPVKAAHKAELAALEQTRPQGTVLPYDYAVQNQLRDQIRLAEAELNALLDKERARKTDLTKQINELRVQKVREDTVAARGEKAMTEAVALAEEIKKIQGSQCPTCSQHWADESSKAKMASMIERAKAFGLEVVAGKEALAQSTMIASRILFLEAEMNRPNHEGLPEANQKITELHGLLLADQTKEREWTSSQNASNQAAIQAYVAKQREILARHQAEIEMASGQAAIAQRTFEMAVQKMRAYAEQKAQYDKVLASLKAAKEQYTVQNEIHSKEIVQNEKQLALAEEAKKIVKSFASCAFDDALEEVGEMATKIVRGIPTMANATISLEGTRETKDGKVKEEVNAVISMDGEINVPIKTLSGGERSSVDLAIDLAVIDLLESKTNKGIDVFVLDEPFTGLDTVGVEMALEVLKSANPSKRLILVDHNPEAKQMIQSKIIVERDGTTSKIVQSS
jgi:DNA repair exonuclease SbcCD ATPase subunit